MPPNPDGAVPATGDAVDPGAGTVEPPWVRACADADLAPNTPLQVVIGGVPIVVVRGSDGVVHALDDTCTHAQVSLSEGFVEGDEIECGAHGAAFDLRSGDALSLPATRALRVYPVAIEAGGIIVSTAGHLADVSDAGQDHP